MRGTPSARHDARDQVHVEGLVGDRIEARFTIREQRDPARNLVIRQIVGRFEARDRTTAGESSPLADQARPPVRMRSARWHAGRRTSAAAAAPADSRRESRSAGVATSSDGCAVVKCQLDVPPILTTALPHQSLAREGEPLFRRIETRFVNPVPARGVHPIGDTDGGCDRQCLVSSDARTLVLCLLCVATLARSDFSFSISRSRSRSCAFASRTRLRAAAELVAMVVSISAEIRTVHPGLGGASGRARGERIQQLQLQLGGGDLVLDGCPLIRLLLQPAAQVALRIGDEFALVDVLQLRCRPRRTAALSMVTCKLFASTAAGRPAMTRRCAPAGISTAPERVTMAPSGYTVTRSTAKAAGMSAALAEPVDPAGPPRRSGSQQ